MYSYWFLLAVFGLMPIIIFIMGVIRVTKTGYAVTAFRWGGMVAVTSINATLLVPTIVGKIASPEAAMISYMVNGYLLLAAVGANFVAAGATFTIKRLSQHDPG